MQYNDTPLSRAYQDMSAALERGDAAAADLLPPPGEPLTDAERDDAPEPFDAPRGEPTTPAPFRVTLTVERIGTIDTSGGVVATDAITVQEYVDWAEPAQVRDAITAAFRRSVVAVQAAWLS